MTIERRNPVPIGRYYIDVFRPDWERFDDWLGRHRRSHVVVESVQMISAPWGEGNEKDSQWILFRVIQPVRWEGPGLPSHAGASVKRQEDVVQRPPPAPSPISSMTETAKGMSGTIKRAIGWGLALGIGGGLLWAISSVRKETQ